MAGSLASLGLAVIGGRQGYRENAPPCRPPEATVGGFGETDGLAGGWRQPVVTDHRVTEEDVLFACASADVMDDERRAFCRHPIAQDADVQYAVAEIPRDDVAR